MMTERRKTLLEDEEAVWPRTPLTILYPALGFLVGLGCPVGALLMRYLRADPYLQRVWLEAELTYNADFYVYMGVGTILAFVIFGYVLGKYGEGQRAHSKGLSLRVEELHIKSVTDGLTGVYSHAYLQETLGIETERAGRLGLPLSTLMLDLDDFKKVNDTHGHLFGDQVLKEVTETISMNIREDDVLGRYGGEEFMVVMPGASSKIAQRVAERVRKAVARTGIVDAAEEGRPTPVKVTLSIGAATYEAEHTGSSHSLIRAADIQLYKAKRAGKNQVSFTTAGKPGDRRTVHRRAGERRT